MKRLLLILAAFSLPAAAQAPAAQPKPAASPDKAAAQPAEPRRPLILRLDEVDGPPMSFGRSASERDPGRELPSLGGDARKLDPALLRGDPYPKSSENLP